MDNIRTINAIDSLSQAFLDYSAYNLQRRAIPDVRDGLKWSARQLIHAQALAKLTYDKPFKKALKSVGQATSFSYTHGDSSCYGTYIRMAKPFAYRYPLQEAHGNYGTMIDPNDHSASRYVELRGSKLASLLLQDLEKRTISEWEDTYDLEGQFPRVLPTKGFYNLVNGCISIGSGMSCSIPQFNLIELNNALIKLINNPNIDDYDLICDPDFATGAILVNRDEVRESLIHGRGKSCKLRAVIEYDPEENALIVKEMPYSVYTNTICKELSALIESDPKCGIKNFLDVTGTSVNLHINLTKNANPSSVIKLLYKKTSLQSHYSVNMIMLDKGETPKVFGWKAALQAHIDHEKEVYRNAFIYDVEKINNRLHILEGLLKAISQIDEVIKIIKSSADAANASRGLQIYLGITEAQAKAILEIKLSRLAHLEISKLEKEQKDLTKEKERIENILFNENLLNQELINGWEKVSKTLGDARRTKIENVESDDDEEPIEKKQLIIHLTNWNNIYTYEESSLISQKRGGVGNRIKLGDGEVIINTLSDSNYNDLLLFSNLGKVYNYSVDKIPLDVKTPLNTLLILEPEEKISTILSDSEKNNSNYIVFVTNNGLIKKTKVNEYNSKREKGIVAIKLKLGDKLNKVFLSQKNNQIGIATRNGYFVRFNIDEVSATKRATSGVKAITLKPGDEVVSATIINESTSEIISITSSGLVKKTDINESSIGSRANKGVIIHKLQENEDLVAIASISENDSSVIVTSKNSCIRFSLDEVRLSSRNTVGTKSIKISESNRVSDIYIE